jgi:hypothetical protein
LLERALKLAGLVSALFAEAGHQLIVVGGSAIEVYTEGGYMSGDIDFCRRELRMPLRLAQDIMARLGATGGPRNWRVCGLFVDMLGVLENESRAPMRTIETPYGPVTLMPRELALAERVLAAYYPQPSDEALKTAKQMMASRLDDPAMDWGEAERLAAMPDFNILGELRRLKTEVENGQGNPHHMGGVEGGARGQARDAPKVRSGLSFPPQFQLFRQASAQGV